MLISLDFDEVIFPLTVPFISWVNPRLKEYGVDKPLAISQIVNYLLPDVLPKEKWLELIHEFYNSPEIINITPLKYAKAGIDCLLDEGHKIMVITGRPPTCDSATRQQLARHDLPQLDIRYSNHYFQTSKNLVKADICAELGVDVHVDDQIEHINEIAKRGIGTIWMKSGMLYLDNLNKEAFVAQGWLDILKIIATRKL